MQHVKAVNSNKRHEIQLDAATNADVDCAALGITMDNFINTMVFADSATLLGFTIVNYSDEEIHVTLKTNTYVPDAAPKRIKIYAGPTQSVTPPPVIYVLTNTGVL